MQVCFLSNGYGEDRSAALIAKELHKIRPSIDIIGAPLLSDGAEYTKHGLSVITKGTVPPSGGFPTQSARAFLVDLFSGFFHRDYYKALKSKRGEITHGVAVGDVPLLVMASYALGRKLAFFATAKSDYMHPHFWIEEYFLRKCSRVVFTRDAFTAEGLKKSGIMSTYVGNPLMEDLDAQNKIDLGGSTVVGILPGSREEAYKNFLRTLTVVEMLPSDITYACALPGSLERERVIKESARFGWTADDVSISKNSHRVLIVEDAFEDVIDKSSVVIGLAGTANEQAAGLGKPVVSFLGTGPQTTQSRMSDQEQLLGGSVKFVRDFPGGVAKEVDMLVRDDKERARRAQIGVERMGGPGAARKAAEKLTGIFKIEEAKQAQTTNRL